MAFCVYCGSKLSENSRFCGSCGAPVVNPDQEATPVAAEEIVSVPPIAEEPVSAPPVVEETSPEAEKTPPVAPETPEEPVASEPAAPEIPSEPLYAAPITREHIRTAATPAAAQPMPFGNKSARGSSASYSYATPERVANPVRNKAVRPRRKFLAVFTSVLLCILLLTAMLPTYALITVRNSLQKETFLAIMQRTDLNQIPASVLDEYDEELEDLTLAELFCETINEDAGYSLEEGVWEDITPADLNRLLKETTFLEFTAEQMEGLINAILSGKKTYGIPVQAMEKLLEDNLPYLAEELNLPLEEDEIEDLAEELIESGDFDDIPIYSEMDSEVRSALEIINLILSVYALGALCLLMLLLVLLLFAVNHRDPLYALRDTGIVCVLGTVFPLLAVLGGRGLVAFAAGKDGIVYIVATVLSCVLESSLTVTASVFGAGVLLLIINGIARKVQKKKELM